MKFAQLRTELADFPLSSSTSSAFRRCYTIDQAILVQPDGVVLFTEARSQSRDTKRFCQAKLP